MARLPNPKTAIRWLALLAAVAAGIIAVSDRWAAVGQRLTHLRPVLLAGAVASSAVFEYLALLSWRSVAKALGSPLSVRTAARVFLVSQLGKYLPGGVWPYLAQFERLRAEGAPRDRAAAVSVVAVLVTLVTGLALAAATLPFYAGAAATRYWPAFLCLPFLAALLWPPVLRRLAAAGGRLARVPVPERDRRLGGMALLGAAGWAGLAWAAAGLQVWAVAGAVGGGRSPGLVACTGSYALAWSVGFLVLVAPAGAGVREAALTLALSSAMPASTALTVALLTRAVTTVADLAAAGAGAAVGRGGDRPARRPRWAG